MIATTTAQPTTIQIESVGRRHYVRGNTFPIKDRLRAAGFKWDRDERAWWTGKRDLAEQVIGATPAAAPAAQAAPAETTVGLDERVIRGRARYEGRTYYVLYHGPTRRGLGARLCSRDGSLVFWAKRPEAVQVVSRYEQPRSIAQLRAYAERRRAEQAGEVECPVCARLCRCDEGFCLHHHDGCDRCGAER